jgi:hypothetical protein
MGCDQSREIVLNSRASLKPNPAALPVSGTGSLSLNITEYKTSDDNKSTDIQKDASSASKFYAKVVSKPCLDILVIEVYRTCDAVLKKPCSSIVFLSDLHILSTEVLSKPEVDILLTRIHRKTTEVLSKPLLDKSVFYSLENLSFNILSKPRFDLFTLTNAKEVYITPEEIVKINETYEKTTATHNSLLFSISIVDSVEVSYTLKKTLKLFEDLMDAKYFLDCKELKMMRKPRELSEFLIDYLNRSFGIQSVAQKVLKQLLVTLETNQSHEYLKLFSRLLKIYTPSPIPLNLLVFLTKLRMDLNKIIKQRSQNLLKFKVDLKKIDAEEKDQGGYAFLTDVFDYVTQSFKDKGTKEVLYQYLSPQKLPVHTYLVFYYLYRVTKTGQSIPNTALAPRSTVLEDIITLIDFNLTPGQLESLTKFIENEETKNLASVLSIKSFEINAATYLISKCEVLSKFIEAYKSLRNKFIELAAKEYRKHSEMNQEKFAKAVFSIDNKVTPDFVTRIYQEGLSHKNNSEIDENTFVFLVVYYHLGPMKEFRKFYVEIKYFNHAYIDRRIDFADICLNTQDAIDINSPLIKYKTLKPL